MTTGDPVKQKVDPLVSLASSPTSMASLAVPVLIPSALVAYPLAVMSDAQHTAMLSQVLQEVEFSDLTSSEISQMHGALRERIVPRRSSEYQRDVNETFPRKLRGLFSYISLVVVSSYS